MKTTVNVHWNKGCISDLHNQRDEELCKNEKHIDLYNIHGQSSYKTLYRQDVTEVYTDVFKSAIDDYNAKQKRKGRRKTVKSYMAEVESDDRGKRQTKFVNGKRIIDEDASRSGKQLRYEITIHVGNTERERDEKGRVKYDNGHHIRTEYLPKELQQACLLEYYETFSENNPNFIITSADLHADEGFYNKQGVWEYSTDHLHICFVPIADGYKQGLRLQNSIGKALKQMDCDDYEIWAKKEQKRLEMILKEQYDAYCKKHPDFAQINGQTVEIYHPMTEGLRKGDADKEHYAKEQELRELEADLNAIDDTLTDLADDVSKREEAVLRRERDVDGEMMSLAFERSSINRKQRNVNVLEEQLNKREADLKQREMKLKQAEADLKQREAELIASANKQVADYCDALKEKVSLEYRHKTGRPLPDFVKNLISEQKNAFQISI